MSARGVGSARTYGLEEETAVRLYVETLPESLHECAEDFIQMRMTEAEVRAFVGAACKSRDPWWTEAEDAEVVRELDANIGKVNELRGIPAGRAHVTTVAVQLTEAQKSALRGEYSAVTDLKFEKNGCARRVEHPYAYATRVISAVQLRRMVEKDAVVIEVGAKIEHAINYGAAVGKYHGVMPVMDFYDTQRHSQSLRQVELMLKRKGRSALKPAQRAVAEAYLNDFDSMFSRKPVQDLTLRGDVVLSQDANYDIPLADAVAFMHRGGVKQWLGSMIRCDDAAIFSGKLEGELDALKFCYRIDADADTIEFNFRSSSFPYRHKLSVYREYQVANNKMFVVGNARYVYKQLPHTTKHQLYFGIYRVENREYEHQPLVYAPTNNEGMLRVYHADATLGARKCEMRHFDIPEEVFSRVLRDRLIATSETDVEVIRSVRAARLAIVVNGIRVSTDQPIAYSMVKSLVSVVKVIAADMKKSGDGLCADAAAVIAQGGYKRKGFVETAVDAVGDMVAGPGSMVRAVWDRLCQLRLDSIGVAVRVERLPGVVRMPDNRVEVLDEVAHHLPSKCYCEERVQVRGLLSGQSGGLTVDEVGALELYLRYLEGQKCDSCEFELPVDGTAEFSFEEKSSDTDGDSGYASCSDGSQTSGAATGTDGSGGGSEDSSSQVSDDDVFFEAFTQFAAGGAGQQEVGCAEGFARDAMEEYVEVAQLQMDAAHSDAVVNSQVMLRHGVSQEALRGCSDGRTSHYVLEVKQGFVVGLIGDQNVVAEDFQRAYDFECRKWYDIGKMRGGQAYVPLSSSRYLYTNTNFLIWNQPKLKAAMKRVLANQHVGPVAQRIDFVNGIYGCGKTREIKGLFGVADMYLTATSRSAKTVRYDLYRDSEVGKRRVRTYDSALMHGVDVEVDVLYLDEMPMAHFGQILALIEMVRPRKVKAYGDFSQICWIPMLANFRAQFSAGTDFCDVVPRPVTHRCRLSVVAATMQYYPEEFRVTSCRCCKHNRDSEEGLSLYRCQSLGEVPINPKVKYLTFTHEEQKAVQKRMNDEGIFPPDDADATSLAVCSTVHEVQGETYDDVCLVRTNRNHKPGTIYFWPRHLVTALTRAKYMTSYYTMSPEIDGVVRAIGDGKSERLRQVVRENADFHFGEV